MKHSGNAASSAGHLPLVIFIRAEVSSSSYNTASFLVIHEAHDGNGMNIQLSKTEVKENGMKSETKSIDGEGHWRSASLCMYRDDAL
jgi:hypothetical protein